ncbi:MAG: hypothetical protein P8018_12275 [Acidobacteriota bacterium]
MARDAKFTDEQKYEIALDLVSGKLSHSEICRKWGISSTYAYKLKDRALEVLRQGIVRPVGRPDARKDSPGGASDAKRNGHESTKNRRGSGGAGLHSGTLVRIGAGLTAVPTAQACKPESVGA